MRDPTNEIDTLNDIIELTMDSYRAYEEAARRCTDETLSSQLTDGLNGRKQLLCSLRHAVQALGGRPETSGTFAGSAQRLLADLCGHLGESDDSRLGELRNMDRRLSRRYGTALTDFRLSDPVRQVLTVGQDVIKGSYNALRRAIRVPAVTVPAPRRTRDRLLNPDAPSQNASQGRRSDLS